jgi:asparagine synthase (glutamine-hydrolysing)
MCGIVGICGSHDPTWLTEMNLALSHRGPDDSGEYRDAESKVSLAMHRLSILDLQSGHQPMSHSRGHLWIVYNGEIFNSPDLRMDLEKRGHVFTTNNSDTEVLLHLYDESREHMLDMLNGMFAFVIHDRKRGVLFGARDRSGIKPLYYVLKPNMFAFASELKALLQLPIVRRQVNPESLYHYMSLRFVPGEETIYGDVRRLAPGDYFTYDLQTFEFRSYRYWRPHFCDVRQQSLADWTANLRYELDQAVERWTLSDVPIGCSRSGGLDSSAIVGLLAKSGRRAVRTYSLGFTGSGEEEWNELPLARLLAEKWGTDHHETVLNPENLLDDLLEMVWHLDEPYGGGLPSWYVFRFMHEHVKVGLTGTGGDELFGDYGRYRRYEAQDGKALPESLERVWSRVASTLNHLPNGWMDAKRKYELMNLPGAGRDPFRWYYFNSYYYFPDEMKRERVFDMPTAGIPDTSTLLQRWYEDSESEDPRNAFSALSFRSQLPEEFLFMTDRFSMAHSVEARVPFLDQKLVDFVWTVPSCLRTRPNDLKYLLRNAVSDLLPPEIQMARKRGFVIPTGFWMRGRLRPLVERLLAPERLRSQGLFNPEFYKQYVLPHVESRADYDAQVWTALMFQLWHLLYIEENLKHPPTFTLSDLC